MKSQVNKKRKSKPDLYSSKGPRSALYTKGNIERNTLCVIYFIGDQERPRAFSESILGGFGLGSRVDLKFGIKSEVVHCDPKAKPDRSQIHEVNHKSECHIGKRSARNQKWLLQQYAKPRQMYGPHNCKFTYYGPKRQRVPRTCAGEFTSKSI